MRGLIYNLAVGEVYEEMARLQIAALRVQLPEIDFATLRPASGTPKEVTLTRPQIQDHIRPEHDFVLQLEPDVAIRGGAAQSLKELVARNVIQVQAGPTQIRRLYPPGFSHNQLPAPWASFVFVPRESFEFFKVWEVKTNQFFHWEERVLLEALSPFIWTYADCVRNVSEPPHFETFIHHLGPDKRTVTQIAA